MSLIGSLEDLGLGEILQIVSLSRRSGVLYLANQSRKGMIVFKMGQVVSASTNEKKLNFVNELVNKGLVTPEAIKDSFGEWKKTDDKKAYSKFLLEKFNIQPSVLNEINKNVIESIIWSFFEWSGGTFNFELKENEGELDGILSSPLLSIVEPGLSPQFLAMEGTRRVDELKRGKTPVPAKSEEGEKIKAELLKEYSEPMVEEKHEENMEVNPPQLKEEYKESLSLTNVLDEVRSELEQSDKLFPEMDEIKKSEVSPGIELLKSLLSELTNPDTTPEISLLILRFTSELMNRAVLLLVKKNEVCGLGGFGIVMEDKNPDLAVREITIPLDEPSIFKDVVTKKYPQKKRLEMVKWNKYFLDKLGGGVPVESYVAPVFAVGRIAAIIYGDNLPEEKEIGDTSALEIFLTQAGLAMEKALLRRKLNELKGKDRQWLRQ
jgi:hypothetical protein